MQDSSVDQILTPTSVPQKTPSAMTEMKTTMLAAGNPLGITMISMMTASLTSMMTASLIWMMTASLIWMMNGARMTRMRNRGLFRLVEVSVVGKGGLFRLVEVSVLVKGGLLRLENRGLFRLVNRGLLRLENRGLLRLENRGLFRLVNRGLFRLVEGGLFRLVEGGLFRLVEVTDTSIQRPKPTRSSKWPSQILRKHLPSSYVIPKAWFPSALGLSVFVFN